MDCLDSKEALNLYIDNALDEQTLAEMRKHAERCEACRIEMKAAEQLRDILSHADDDIAVPLPVQAAWRNAVRLEARGRRMKNIYRVCGAVAAVCVLTMGVTTMLSREDDYGLPEKPLMVAAVEADGVSAQGSIEGAAMSRSISYFERRVVTDNPDTAYAYLNDILAEYGGVLERETSDTDGRKVFVQVPGDGAADFIAAVDHLGLYADEGELPDLAAEQVGICVVIAAE